MFENAQQVGFGGVTAHRHINSRAARNLQADDLARRLRCLLCGRLGGLLCFHALLLLLGLAGLCALSLDLPQQTQGATGIGNGLRVTARLRLGHQIEADIALGTGHGTPAETLVVVEEARKLGVNKIVVNHPEWTTVDMSIADQKRLAQFDVFFERCYARNVDGRYDKNFQRNLEAMQTLGYESTIVATDGGQVENPMWSEALAEYITFLLQAGVPQAAVDRMTRSNPAKVLGLQ